LAAFAFTALWSTRVSDPSFPEFLPLLMTLVSFMAACTAVNLMPAEVTGVKLRKDGLHEVRRPGDAMSVEYPRDPGAA
jgi:hypothetical protein